MADCGQGTACTQTLINPESKTDPLYVPICSADASDSTATVPTVDGFKMCVGTIGSGSVSTNLESCVSNQADTAATTAYLQQYNQNKQNPGITQGQPTSATSGINAVPPISAAYGCSIPANWNFSATDTTQKIKASNGTRATQVYPFSTASRVGAKDSGNLSGGLPKDLLAMNKCWGLSSGSWMHGGVAAGNVGQWNAPSGKGFLVKLPDGTKWTQSSMLWTRLTGDDYAAELDPYGAICPAPNGMAKVKVKLPVDTKNDGGTPFCGCDVPTMAAAAAGTKWNPSFTFPTEINCGDVSLPDDFSTNPAYSSYGSTTVPNAAVSDVPNGYTNPKGRVGGCFVTNAMFGPGKFSVLANLPPTAPVYAKDDPVNARLMLAPTAADGKTHLMVDSVTGDYPSTAPTAVPYGRGYVFAMWTFNYTEAYQADPTLAVGKNSASPLCPTFGQPFNVGMMNANSSDAAPTCRDELSNCINKCSLPGDGVALPVGMQAPPGCGAAPKTACGSPCVYDYFPTDASGNVPPGQMCNCSNCGCGVTPGTFTAEVATTAPGSVGGLGNAPVTYTSMNGTVVGDGYCSSMTSHNHEIDIEIPSNSAPLQGGDMTTTLGANSANFNTWVTDTQTYNTGATAYYQQAQCLAPPGQYFMAVGPDDDQDTFHEYSFVWYVDPGEVVADQSKSYVAFYRDGVELFRTHRYVPRRSGRLVVGVWPAWWGSNYAPLTFNQVYVKIARLDIVPQCDYNNKPFSPLALITNGAQLYDQDYPAYSYRFRAWTPADSSSYPSYTDGQIVDVPAGTIRCGIAEPLSRIPRIITKGTTTNAGLQWWAWLLIAVAIAVVVAGAVLGGLYGAGKWKPGRVGGGSAVSAVSARRPATKALPSAAAAAAGGRLHSRYYSWH